MQRLCDARTRGFQNITLIAARSLAIIVLLFARLRACYLRAVCDHGAYKKALYVILSCIYMACVCVCVPVCSPFQTLHMHGMVSDVYVSVNYVTFIMTLSYMYCASSFALAIVIFCPQGRSWSLYSL